MLKEPTPEYCRELLSYIPRLPYPEWIEAVAAVANTFPYDVALDLLTSRWRDEEPGETAYKMQDGVRLEKPDFRCLVNLAKRYGYTPKGNTNRTNYIPVTPRPTPEPDPVSFADADESSVLINSKGERVFRLAVNVTVRNKTTDFEALTNNYQNVQLTLSDIAEVVGQGYAICGAQMVTNPDGTITRKSSNFLQSEVIILDLDFSVKQNGEKVFDTANYIPLDVFLDTPAAEHVALAYTSYSHTPEWNRYRLLMPLPYLETNPERYQKILKTFIAEYKADAACSDICRPFYGNTNATIYNLVSGEVRNA